MPRFLHLADIHLGCAKYDNRERSKDFFLALQDALSIYALDQQVDFVLIVGDLFEHRNILPGTLNQAQACLEMLREAGIPVLAIEGNHDYEPYGSKSSWLRYLADWEQLILLEPEDGEALEPWSPDTRRGGYIDLPCGVRVIGSRWYRSSAPKMLEQLATQIHQLPTGPNHTVMMLHQGLEGQIARYSGALRSQELQPLKSAGVDYLALGHIHKHYSVDGWIFNPGSLEANSIAEGQDQIERGALLVEINGKGIQHQLKRDYWQRPIVRLSLKAEKTQTREELIQAAIAQVKAAATAGKTQDVIVELRIQGQVGFNRLDLNVRELKQQLHKLSQALIFLLKYEVSGTRYDTYIATEDGLPTRASLEKTVFMDLIAGNPSYSEQLEPTVNTLIQLKTKILEKRTDLNHKKKEVDAIQELYAFVSSSLSHASEK